MVVRTFRRGLKVPSRKYATEGKPIERLPLPKQVVIPINQHFGVANKPIVNIGDKVIRGQKIADAAIVDAAISVNTAVPGHLTVPVHASISGTVSKIEPRPLSNNSYGLCIIIESDGNTDEEFMSPLDPFTCSKEDVLVRIRNAGIIGMGGAGFPAHIKYSLPPDKPVDVIIANGAECEPYLTTDEAAMMEKPHLLVKGIEIVKRLVGVNRAIIGIEDNKKALIPVIEKAISASKVNGEISIGLCKTRYPQGGEKMLITALTGRQVPSGGLPMDVGCIVQNAGTLMAIAEAFIYGKPLIDRDLTISGGACKTPKNICVPIGAVIKDFPVDFMDIDYSRLVKIIFGGPMMGFAVPSLEIPVQKNTSGVVLMTRQETVVEEEGPCIRCSRCVLRCPCILSPVQMYNSLEVDDLDYAVKYGLQDCMECGSCTYRCPARIKLVQRFRIGKQKLRMRKTK